MEKLLLVSIDMDDLWCFEEQAGLRKSNTSILKMAAMNALELFDKYSIKATFFCIAKDRDILKNIITEIVKCGHEIGNHSYHHKFNKTLAKKEKIEDIDASTNMLEDISGEKVIGYRSPGWGCDEETLDILAQKEYKYDASLAISPLFILLRQYHRLEAMRKTYIYGSFKENFGIKPKSKIQLVPMTPVLFLPFYGSFHLYAPFGMNLFMIQKYFIPTVMSYVFHAIDFVNTNSSAKTLKKNVNHKENLIEILKTISKARNSMTIKQYIRNIDKDIIL